MASCPNNHTTIRLTEVAEVPEPRYDSSQSSSVSNNLHPGHRDAAGVNVCPGQISLGSIDTVLPNLGSTIGTIPNASHGNELVSQRRLIPFCWAANQGVGSDVNGATEPDGWAGCESPGPLPEWAIFASGWSSHEYETRIALPPRLRGAALIHVSPPVMVAMHCGRKTSPNSGQEGAETHLQAP